MAAEIQIHEAGPGDAAAIPRLIHELAATYGEVSPLTEAYAREYLAAPGCHVLLAERTGQIAGLLSYSLRPNLYHAGPTALVEELVVAETARGSGVGSALLKHLLAHLAAGGCTEVSVSTMSENEGAKRFYRAHGLVDESVLLEKHLGIG
jgi:ribosomal protein S18 acetylase RimI-like enzyme